MSRDARGARVAERYLLEQELSRSWSGILWRARDLAHDRLVALERFDPGEPAPLERRLRFLRQVEVLARAPAHPHVLGVLDLGEDDGSPYVVSEYLPDARPLSGWTGAPLPVEEVLAVRWRGVTSHG